jgi:hypothetical protein
MIQARHDADFHTDVFQAVAGLGLPAGSCSVIEDAAGYAPVGATFINGALARHSLDFDDAHAASLSHLVSARDFLSASVLRDLNETCVLPTRSGVRLLRRSRGATLQCGEASRAAEFAPPRAHRTVREPLDSYGSNIRPFTYKSRQSTIVLIATASEGRLEDGTLRPWSGSHKRS